MTVKAGFKDHFSGLSKGYSDYRPTYPTALFSYLAGLVKNHDVVWDCATGTGQAASGIAPYFKQVIATDASAPQIDMASGPENVDFRVAPAEKSGLPDHSVDLITVALAIHWFDHDAFYQEVRRVLKPDGILAVWCYGLLSISPEIDEIYLRLYHDIVGPYWPPERTYIDEDYESLSFPFKELSAPNISMSTEWTLDHLIGYLGTWSAVKNYKQAHGHDPLDLVRDDFKAAWGDRETIRTVSWPLSFRIGYSA